MSLEKPDRRSFLKGLATGAAAVFVGKEIHKQVADDAYSGAPQSGSVEGGYESEVLYTSEGFLDRGPSNKQATYQAFLQRFISEHGSMPLSVKQYDFELDDDATITFVVRDDTNTVIDRMSLLSAEQVEAYPIIPYSWFKESLENYFSGSSKPVQPTSEKEVIET